MEYYFVTFSDGSTALMSHVPGVLSMGVAPVDGIAEVSRVLLPEMTHDAFTTLLRQTADHVLRYDEATRQVVAVPKPMPKR